MLESKLNLGAVAMGKSAYLQSLIDKLNSTTVGGLSDRIDSNDTDITVLGGRIDSNDTDISTLSGRAESHDTDIATLSGRIDSNDTDIALINEKINTIASLFSLLFNSDGSLSSEVYTSHVHEYIDSTIADTVDGTGTQTDTTKTTTGVK